jgi:protease-4
MSYSHLLSSIVKGKWAILPRAVESQYLIVDKMINGDYMASEGARVLLSDEKPILMDILSADQEPDSARIRRCNLDDLPENSTLVSELTGTMLKYGTMCSYGTMELAQAMLCIASHPNIGSVVVKTDSGGGAVDAIAPMVDAVQIIQAMGKPVVASVDLCASAAYYFACHCDLIIADNNISSEIGSIGVMMSFNDFSKYYEKEGVIQHKIYSSLSDWKNRPFELALEGKYDEIKSEELDPLARSFQETVRAKRGEKLKQETPGILAGRMFLAQTAKEIGLIDQVGNEAMAITRARELRQRSIVNQYYKF